MPAPAPRPGVVGSSWTTDPELGSTATALADRPVGPQPRRGLGEQDHAGGRRTTTATNATAYIALQPKAGSQRPSSAAAEPPIGTPDIMMVATADRLRALDELCGQGVGRRHEAAQPQAGEERKRPKTSGLGAKAHSAVKSENHRVDQRIVRRRPSGRREARREGAEEHAGEGQAADEAGAGGR